MNLKSATQASKWRSRSSYSVCLEQKGCTRSGRPNTETPRGSPQGPRSTHGCSAAAMSPRQPAGVAKHEPCEMQQGQRRRAEPGDTAPSERGLQVRWTRHCFEQDAGGDPQGPKLTHTPRIFLKLFQRGSSRFHSEPLWWNYLKNNTKHGSVSVLLASKRTGLRCAPRYIC